MASILNKENNRPDINDLKWEVLRRNSEYKEVYKKLQDDPAWAKKPIWGRINGEPFYFKNRCELFKYKWNINKIANPPISWKRFKTTPTKQYTIHQKIKANIFLPKDNALDPVQIFGFKSIEDKEVWDDYKNNFLWLRIDPMASKKTIKHLIEAEIAKGRKGRKISKDKIEERMRWLKIVDRVDKKKNNPDRTTFEKAYQSLCEAGLINKPKSNPDYHDYDRIIDRYTKGKVLIKKPFADPLRESVVDEAISYQTDHNLMLPEPFHEK